jgi:protein-S-isoprenylcysteine O-methyltransferase Ste14
MLTHVHEYINALWIALGALWLVGAFTAKRKVRVDSSGRRLIHVGLVTLAFVLLFKSEMGAGPLGWRFVPETPAAAYTGFTITLAGLLLAAFARLFLGSNWSGAVAIKENHQLVRRGPYALVRHPIYSGLLLAMLGTAIAFGEVRCLLGLLLAIPGFWQKSLQEEQFLVQEFGTEYVQYRTEVKALIPFIL